MTKNPLEEIEKSLLIEYTYFHMGFKRGLDTSWTEKQFFESFKDFESYVQRFGYRGIPTDLSTKMEDGEYNTVVYKIIGEYYKCSKIEEIWQVR